MRLVKLGQGHEQALLVANTHSGCYCTFLIELYLDIVHANRIADVF